MFKPDYSIYPGQIIKEYLEANSIKDNTFADLIGKTPKWMSEFLNGKAPLTAETALDIEDHTHYNAVMLMRVEVNFRVTNERKKRLLGWNS